jgi:arylsulfatase A-like enzyme
MYLPYAGLIPLYATEWICLGFIGACASAFIVIFEASFAKLTGRVRKADVSRAAFSMVIAAAIVIGIQAWIESFDRSLVGPKVWHLVILCAVIMAGAGSWLRSFESVLARFRTVALPISIAGALSLLSAAWIHFPAPRDGVSKTEALGDGAAHPNIVMISIDALAARHLNPYGSIRNTSPNIAGLASASMVFDRFYSVGNFTTTAISTMLTGVMPWTHRAVQLPGTPLKRAVAQSLPRRLHESGYATAYFASNPWAAASRLGFAADFDYRYSGIEWETAPCFDRLADRFPYLCASAGNPLVALVFKTLTRGASAGHLINYAGFADPAPITAAAMQWLKRPHNAPVFMWVHYLPPHDPYAPPSPWLGRFDSSADARTSETSHPLFEFNFASEPKARVNVLESRYDEAISYVDYYVGRLISDARASLGPNTAIILTADHGESFSHGYGGHGGVMLYEDLIHIPLIIALPGAASGLQHRGDLSYQADLAPTIAAIAGIAPSPAWEGKSLTSSTGNLDRTVFTMSFEQNRSRNKLSTGSVAALSGDWKIMRFLGQPRYAGMPELKTELFNVALDPQEKDDVSKDHPDVVAELSNSIDDQLKSHGAPLGE